jgi:hypothetical protein
MKTLALIVLAISFFSFNSSSQAGDVRGYYRSNGTYVQPHYRSSSGFSSGQVQHYRNPYAADPVVHVNSYQKSDGTRVMEHYRTPANSILTDNLSYRGFGSIRRSY